MSRRIVVAVFLVAGLAGTATAQTVVNWPQWIGAAKQAIVVKDTSIKEISRYRDQTCHLQKTEHEQSDCTSRLNTIIERREKEKGILRAMLAATTLDGGDRDVIISIVQPVFRKMNDETTSLYNEFFKIYPPRQ